MDQQRIEDIAELKVRQYFDAFEERLAARLRGERHFMHLTIEKHDTNKEAHGGVEGRFNRAFWLLIGAVSVGGLGGGWGLLEVFKII